MVAIDRKFDVQKAYSACRSTGKAYVMPSYPFEVSPAIIRTGKRYYGSLTILAEMIKRGELPEDTRFMTQLEGLTIERSYLLKGNDPAQADEFKDYFIIKNEDNELFEWTSTGLRVPKGWENGRIDSGTGKYPRIVLIDDQEKRGDPGASRRRENHY